MWSGVSRIHVFVADLGNSHGAQPTREKDVRKTKPYSNFILASNGELVSRIQHKRMGLACQKKTQDGKNSAQTDEAKMGAKTNNVMNAR